jgi:hypothetical protein
MKAVLCDVLEAEGVIEVAVGEESSIGGDGRAMRRYSLVDAAGRIR